MHFWSMRCILGGIYDDRLLLKDTPACIYSPESYSLNEKKEICNDMMATSKAVLDAMRNDFEQLPPLLAPSSWTCSVPPA